MAVPKRKTSPSKRGSRRAHDALRPLNLVVNRTSGELQLPHHVCPAGFYKAKDVMTSRKVEKTTVAQMTQEETQEEIQEEQVAQVLGSDLESNPITESVKPGENAAAESIKPAENAEADGGVGVAESAKTGENSVTADVEEGAYHSSEGDSSSTDSESGDRS